MSEETLYIGHNNVMTKVFKQDGVAIDLGSDKIQLDIYDTDEDNPDFSFNTTDDASLFDRSQAASGQITFKPISTTFQPSDEGKYRARYIWYPSGYPSGIVFPEFIIILRD